MTARTMNKERVAKFAMWKHPFEFEGKTYSMRRIGKPNGKDPDRGFIEYYLEPKGEWTGDISLGPTYAQAIEDFKMPKDSTLGSTQRFALVKMFDGLPDQLIEFETKTDAERALRQYTQENGKSHTHGSCITKITKG